ncbi:MAG: hypothetical protein ACLQUY_00480 [Ktedonobacterales bacterium]
MIAALAPAETTLAPEGADAFAQLKRDLAVIVSAEALFTLTDTCGLSPEDAIASAARLATITTVTALNRGCAAQKGRSAPLA